MSPAALAAIRTALACCPLRAPLEDAMSELTPEALAQARQTVRECSHVDVLPVFPFKAACCQCIALALTKTAHEPGWRDRIDHNTRLETSRRDRELERMILAIPLGGPLGRETYIADVVAVVRRHNNELVAALGRKEILIDYLEWLLNAVRGKP